MIIPSQDGLINMSMYYCQAAINFTPIQQNKTRARNGTV